MAPIITLWFELSEDGKCVLILCVGGRHLDRCPCGGKADQFDIGALGLLSWRVRANIPVCGISGIMEQMPPI